MPDYTYQIHSDENGDHILVFKDEAYEHKIFVSKSEMRPDVSVSILDRDLRILFFGRIKLAFDWLNVNEETSGATMVAMGADAQILSVREFKELHG